MSYLITVLDDCKTLIRQYIIYLLSAMCLKSPTLQHILFWVCRHETTKGPYCRPSFSVQSGIPLPLSVTRFRFWKSVWSAFGNPFERVRVRGGFAVCPRGRRCFFCCIVSLYQIMPSWCCHEAIWNGEEIVAIGVGALIFWFQNYHSEPLNRSSLLIHEASKISK